MAAEEADDFAPIKCEELRRVLGSAAVVADIESWLPYARRKPGGHRWRRGLEEMRRGLDVLAGAVRYLGNDAWEALPDTIDIPIKSAHGLDVAEARLFGPHEIYSALAWLNFTLGPRQGRGRPKDAFQTWVGVRVANIFDEHDEPVTFWREGRFALALCAVLGALGQRAPTDPLHLLRRVRREREGLFALPAFSGKRPTSRRPVE